MQASLLKKYVDLDAGVVSREVYTDPDIYRQEIENIYDRAWLFVGHDSQIPNNGDFVISRMGEEEVILTRDRVGKIHVFLNTCRHRGMKVCRYDDGNTLIFTCPFHGWSYDTDGRLVGVPYFEQAYHGELDREAHGLHEVAQMCNYFGSIWATWDRGAPSFEDYLGAFAPVVARCFEASDGTDAGVEVFVPAYKWRIPCNWKFPAFSFDGDHAHGAMTHRSINAAAIGPQGNLAGGDRHPVRGEKRYVEYDGSDPVLGHGGHFPLYDSEGIDDYVDTWLTEPGVDDYFKMTNAKRQEKYKGQYVHGASALIFPNANIQSQRLLIWHPHAPGVTESWRLYPVDREAPQFVKDALRHYQMRYGGPCGLTESDDMENWNYASAASTGSIAQRLDYNFQMGLGHAHGDERVPGLAFNFRVSEENQRSRLARWFHFMEADSWADIPMR